MGLDSSEGSGNCFPTAATIISTNSAMPRGRSWNSPAPGTERPPPLVNSNRFKWFDGQHHDAIVDGASSIDVSGRIGALVDVTIEAVVAGRGGSCFLSGREITALAPNTKCARAAWPDEFLRACEIERQFPAVDATFSHPFAGPVVVGDRIRWTLVHPGDTLRSHLDGDTPQIETVVEGFSPFASRHTPCGARIGGRGVQYTQCQERRICSVVRQLTPERIENNNTINPASALHPPFDTCLKCICCNCTIFHYAPAECSVFHQRESMSVFRCSTT